MESPRAAYGSYAAGKAGNWREAFKQGTIATVLTILAVVTAGKGLKSLIKKGGAAALGAAENAAALDGAASPKGGTYKLVDRETGRVRRTGRTKDFEAHPASPWVPRAPNLNEPKISSPGKARSDLRKDLSASGSCRIPISLSARSLGAFSHIPSDISPQMSERIAMKIP